MQGSCAAALGMTRTLRLRVEKVCVQPRAAFAAKLPNGEQDTRAKWIPS